MNRFMLSIAAALACAGLPGTACAHSGHAPAKESVHATPGMSAEQIEQTPVATALHVSACWVRLLPAPAPSAAYFELTNSGRHDAVLQAAASPAYGNVMLHLTEETGGVSRMHPAGEIVLPAGGKVAFAPGGYHVMLMQPSRPLAVGDAMPLALLFAGPEHVAASCKVRPADAMGAN